MGEILVITEHRQGELSAGSLEAITAAVELKQSRGLRVAVSVLASDPSVYTEQVSVDGVDEIINVTTPVDEFQSDIFESVTDGLMNTRNAEIVLIPHSIDAWGYAPALAARRGCGFATDVFGIHYDGDDLIATRAAYSEKLHMELDFPGKDSVLITLRGNTYNPAEGTSTPNVVQFEMPDVSPRTEHQSFIEPEATSDVDISQAEYMLSVGRGVAEEDNIEQFQELADSMNFTLGCSRPIADNGWLPKSRQVGQSGKTVTNCTTYLAFGISGSVQHMAGMKHVSNIIAVNTDAEASIFTIARYGVVADMFDIAEELQNHFE